MNNIKGWLIIVSVMIPMNSHAGFADTLRDLRNTLGQVSETTKQVAGISQDVKNTSGQNQQAAIQTNLVTGQTLRPKINNISLYQSANKSSAVMYKLSKSTDLVFSGNVQQGLYEVATDHGTGWVEGHLVQ
ncbi:hypothetical protein EXE30_08150 [Acinetobacter halotolerans]|uniref:SH3 domain-containing protein n=1 Tax=Acinetobacter halotolerans TaxID=1752076 RepID=A0A4Q6XIN6_9GAMM|nr:hypothetical protein [Acinetobacter halotolerans]RZF53088.1 hypothetical protein EXE30_08150 [Acinetobacter halotolerans]